jgi:hypothetical protein
MQHFRLATVYSFLTSNTRWWSDVWSTFASKNAPIVGNSQNSCHKIITNKHWSCEKIMKCNLKQQLTFFKEAFFCASITKLKMVFCSWWLNDISLIILLFYYCKKEVSNKIVFNNLNLQNYHLFTDNEQNITSKQTSSHYYRFIEKR